MGESDKLPEDVVAKQAPAVGAVAQHAAGAEPIPLGNHWMAFPDADRAKLLALGTRCPFIGSIEKAGLIEQKGTLHAPIGTQASVAAQGDAGGGDLGSTILKLFMTINHHNLVGQDGTIVDPETKQAVQVPSGYFGLWFPGSDGAHPAHTGIMMGNPSKPGTGTFNQQRLDDLNSYASVKDEKGRDALTNRDIGKFIGTNVASWDKTHPGEPAARGLDHASIADHLRKLHELHRRAARGEPPKVVAEELFHLLITGNDLFNSAGEFALLVVRFRDGTHTTGGKVGEFFGLPAHSTLSTEATTKLFKDNQLPEGWDNHPAYAAQWIAATTSIAFHAVNAWVAIQIAHGIHPHPALHEAMALE